MERVSACCKDNCDCYDKIMDSRCKVFRNPNKEVCKGYLKESRIKKTPASKKLKKCTCGKLPEVITGKHFEKELKMFSVECRNPQCKEKPKTADYKTQAKARAAWNAGLFTASMFPGVV